MSQDFILKKYAESATYLLEKNFPQVWTDAEAVKLAQELMDLDLEKAAEYDKVAEWDTEGRILARAFYDELQKQAGLGTAVKAIGNLAKTVAKPVGATAKNTYIKGINAFADTVAKHPNSMLASAALGGIAVNGLSRRSKD